MTTFSNSPKLLKGGIVLNDSTTSSVIHIIALQYNLDTLSHAQQIKRAEKGINVFEIYTETNAKNKHNNILPVDALRHLNEPCLSKMLVKGICRADTKLPHHNFEREEIAGVYKNRRHAWVR